MEQEHYYAWFIKGKRKGTLKATSEDEAIGKAKYKVATEPAYKDYNLNDVTVRRIR